MTDVDIPLGGHTPVVIYICIHFNTQNSTVTVVDYMTSFSTSHTHTGGRGIWDSFHADLNRQDP